MRSVCHVCGANAMQILIHVGRCSLSGRTASREGPYFEFKPFQNVGDFVHHIMLMSVEKEAKNRHVVSFSWCVMAAGRKYS